MASSYRATADLRGHPLNPVRLHPDASKPVVRSHIKPPDLPKLAWDPPFKAFLDELNAAGVDIWVRVEREGSDRFGVYPDESNKAEQPRVFLMNTYIESLKRSDLDGGSRHVPTDPADIPPDEDWQRVLLMCWQDIPFFKETHLRAALGGVHRWHENEYYGDGTDWRSDTIDLAKLYAVLKLENKTVVNAEAKRWQDDVRAVMDQAASPALVGVVERKPRSP